MARSVNTPQAKPQLSNLRLRVLSALVLGPLVLGAVYLGGVAFDILMLLAATLMIHEWCKMTAVPDLLPTSFVTLTVVALVAYGDLADAFTIFAFGAFVLYGLALARKHSPVWPVLGMVYVVLPIASLLLLRNYFPQGMTLVFWLFAAVWATDIGGYAAGKTLGGPKLAPSISPSKTWSGLLGGMVLAAIAGAVFAPYLGGMSMIVWAGVSAGMAVVAQLGDLLESKIKRMFNVKDSGSLIPGHGGLLDRVDGIVTVAPLVLIAMTKHGGALLVW
ncbi:MAG: phosphatidate cytidylyltransferase [Alphaproteobacteria bacterium]|nr:phosphatidate cytidylyltransferase [Alphaproteobacteria bacterium]